MKHVSVETELFVCQNEAGTENQRVVARDGRGRGGEEWRTTVSWVPSLHFTRGEEFQRWVAQNTRVLKATELHA